MVEGQESCKEGQEEEPQMNEEEMDELSNRFDNVDFAFELGKDNPKFKSNLMLNLLRGLYSSNVNESERMRKEAEEMENSRTDCFYCGKETDDLEFEKVLMDVKCCEECRRKIEEREKEKSLSINVVNESHRNWCRKSNTSCLLEGCGEMSLGYLMVRRNDC